MKQNKFLAFVLYRMKVGGWKVFLLLSRGKNDAKEEITFIERKTIRSDKVSFSALSFYELKNNFSWLIYQNK